MTYLLVGTYALLGAVAGSFITALVPRLRSGEPIVRDRSRCIHCGQVLGWRELIPLLSFIAQSGRCRSCSRPIPWTYPAVELITAFLFTGLGWALAHGVIAPAPFLVSAFGGTLDAPIPLETAASFIYYAVFITGAVAVSLYDFFYRLIPGGLVWILVAIATIARLGAGIEDGNLAGFFNSAEVGLMAFAVFWSLWFFSRGRGMGRGDADVAAAIGLYLEPAVAIAGFLFALWLGALVGILLVAFGRFSWRSAIPFAPFLFAGALVALASARYLNPIISSLYGF